MRILVTGLDGFAGPYVAAALRARGHEVAGLRHKAKGANPVSPDVQAWYTADLVDFSAVQALVDQCQPEAVVHLAAVSFVGHSNIDEIYINNIVGTRNLLEALSVRGLSGRAIIVSSGNVYGNRTVGPLHETLSPDPRSDYALSKLACEHLAAMYADRVPTMVVRPFNYTGRGQSELFIIPKIIAHTRARAPEIEMGNVDVARDFSDVRFFAEAAVRLLECPEAGGLTVNICSGHAVKLTELLDLVAEISGHRMAIRTHPSFVRAQELESLWGDDRLLQRLIGPLSGPSLSETLNWMLRDE